MFGSFMDPFNLVAELNADGNLHNYICSTKVQFDDIVDRITPVVQCNDTNFQVAITPGERLIPVYA